MLVKGPQVTHLYTSLNRANTASVNGILSVRRAAISWTNANLMSIRPYANTSEISKLEFFFLEFIKQW